MQSRGKIFMFVFEQYKMIQYTMGKTGLLYHCIDGSQSVSLSYLKLKLKLCFHFSFFTFSFSKPAKHEELLSHKRIFRPGTYLISFFMFHNINTIRIKSSENKQQPGVSRSGRSQWEEAKLGSAVEKLKNFNPFFHWRHPLIHFWGLHNT